MAVIKDKIDIDVLVTKKTKRGVKQIHVMTGTLLKCDNESCGREFVRIRKGRTAHDHLNFCNLRCAQRALRRGGSADKKRKKTNLERFGASSWSSLQESKTRVRETKTQRHGDPNFVNVEQRKKTNFDRYGVTCVLAREDVKQKKVSPEARKKRHKTMLMRGICISSKPERALRRALEDRFGHKNVKKQVLIDGRPIDMFVKTIDTYVQHDGSHWHWIDKDVDELRELAKSSKHFAEILENVKRDAKQNEHFEKNGLRLVRISEDVVKKCMKKKDFSEAIALIERENVS